MRDVDFDIIVIGAGISGIAFARFYLDIHPATPIALIEANSCAGGVWCSTRLYDEFWTQSGRRMVGFSDVPLGLPPDAPSYHGTIEAKYVTRYLEGYIDSHVYNGSSLRSRIHFGQRVVNVERVDEGWKVCTRSFQNDQVQEFRCSKVAVATGLTSQPNIPTFLHHEDFQAPICHHKNFGEISKKVLDKPECKNVTVLGGGKSATDMVYEAVKKGKNVNWIIRKDGEGPALFFPAEGPGGRYEGSTEASTNRWNASFSPSSFMPDSWSTTLIHRTRIGLDYLRNKISRGTQACKEMAAYHTRENALPSFKDLEPTPITSAFWCTGPLGLVQHDDFWPTLAEHVHIYRSTITHLSPTTIHLSSTESIPTDLLLLGTGWHNDYPFFSPQLTRDLGLPSPGPETDEWTTLLAEADARVLSNFPILADPPTDPRNPPSPPHPTGTEPLQKTTLKLYAGILPLPTPNQPDPSIIFLSRTHVSNAFLTAESQAIWSTALFDHHLSLPPPPLMEKRIAYMNAFSRRRYPSRGGEGDWLFFELVSYVDWLLGDVGVGSHRRKGLWGDLVEPCLVRDLGGVAGEYRKKFGY